MPDDGVLHLQLPEKLAFLLAEKARYKVVYGGRGGMKSWGFTRAGIIRCVQAQTRFVCAREIMRTIADSVHQLLADQIAMMNVGWHFNVTDNEIKGRNGSQFIFTGLRNLDAYKIKSLEGADVCFVEEANALGKKSWNVLGPTIRKNDSEIWIGFNPELDTDEAYVRFVVNPPEDSIVVRLNYDDNPWPTKALDTERADCLKRYGADSDDYRNIWLGEPRSAVEGAIYAREIAAVVESGRVRPVPIDPMLKVHTIWDLGWADQTSIILVQRDATSVRVVGFVENTHHTMQEYAAELESLRLNWGTDYLPHDAVSKHVDSGKSPQEVLRTLRQRVDIVPNLEIEQGIKAARLMFPRLYFSDSPAVAQLLEHLKRYRRRINQQTQTAEGPLHDEHSDAADAFRYLAVIVDRLSNDAWMKPPMRRVATGIV